MTRALLAATFCLAALAAPGCGPACHPTERVVTEGVRDLEGPVRTFATSPPEGPFLPFEGGTLLRIRHGLGVSLTEPPRVSLSFTERPLDQAKGGFSPAAGNQAITLKMDSEEVAIKNDSCANYFIRVVVVGYPADDAATAAADTSTADATTADTSVSDAADGG